MRLQTGISRALLALLPLTCFAIGMAARGGKEPEVKDLDAFLDKLYQYGLKNTMWNVRPADGKFLEILVASSGSKEVLELGTANGYSGIWICRGLHQTGGSLVTVEINPTKAEEARGNFRKAGMDSMVKVINGDATKVIPTLKEKFDMIFLDTEKGGYMEQFRLSFPLLKPGGVYVAHNAVLMADSMKEFLDTVKNHPELRSVIVQTSDDGFSLSYRTKER